MKVLIIIDAQNDFMPGGALAVEGGDAIVGPINRLQKKFDLVVATQDWHPKNHMSFASSHEGKKPFDRIEWQGMDQTLWPDHCVQGSKGAEFHENLQTDRIEAIFRKGMDPEIDSYSGFYDNGYKKSTGLAGYLREKNANELYFCGLAADICVAFSIRDALKEGFSATLVEDATRALDGDAFKKIRNEFEQKGVKFVTSGDL